MTKIKICGLMRSEDCLYANEVKPDYVGFVFAESKRQLTIETAIKLGTILDRSIKRVGVFVNPSREYVSSITKSVNIDIVQLHGDEAPTLCDELELPVWKAFRIKNSIELAKIMQYEGKIEAIVLDKFEDKSFGGTGKNFDWEIAKGIKFPFPLVLAGGLNCENVESAIKALKPTVVDVSSGVEVDGKKDFSRIADFVRRVRSIDD